MGEDGSIHHALEDLSLMGTLPNLIILIPSDNIELREILEYTFNNKGPFYIRLPRGSFPKIHTTDYKFSLGKPDKLKEGDDICLIGMGYGSILAINSAHSLEKQFNISLKVVNLPTIKPINTKLLINEIKGSKGLIVLEEHNTYCGFGSILAKIISENYPLPMRFIGINNAFGESGRRESLLDSYGLNEREISKNIHQILKFV